MAPTVTYKTSDVLRVSASGLVAVPGRHRMSWPAAMVQADPYPPEGMTVTELISSLETYDVPFPRA